MNTEPLLSVTIPLELTNGNKGQGHKWYKSDTVRKQIEKLLIKEGLEREPFDHPVRLVMTRILKSKQQLWDTVNFWRGNSKQLVDALVAVGWFVDDSTKWILEPAIGLQDASQRKNGPATKIDLYLP
ncbi:hypothetical protein ACMFWY_22245 [Roseiconus sp. JC912]